MHSSSDSVRRNKEKFTLLTYQVLNWPPSASSISSSDAKNERKKIETDRKIKTKQLAV